MTIAVDKVRRHRRAVRATSAAPGGDGPEKPARPTVDFVDLTVVRLELTGERREIAEATRWLGDSAWDVLALWWLEACGVIDRAELAEALDLSRQQAAVLLDRLTAGLASARVAQRALAAVPGCRELRALVEAWSGVPDPGWRERITDHASRCVACFRCSGALTPPENVLGGLPLVPLPGALATGTGASSGSSAGEGHRRSRRSGRRRPVAAVSTRVWVSLSAAGAVTGVCALAALCGGPAQAPSAVLVGPVDALETATARPAPPDEPPAVVAAGSASPEPSAAVPAGTQSPSGIPSAAVAVTSPVTLPAAPSAGPSLRSSASLALRPSATPTPSSITPDPARGPAPQVVMMVNAQRRDLGCAPLRSDARLQYAAQRHADDMAARRYFGRVDPDGAGPERRIDEAGYPWTGAIEANARGQQDAATVMSVWTADPSARSRLLDCGFTDIGVGVHPGDGGPWWTLDLGTTR
ncbi:RNA polymerase [Kitasatospora aureofaciens]|uniref:CAP domain-containing protein n=1 Tax=Kitasatospora aureofaciens TaxID=1894 RepID=UPI001C493165|nr:CAP domain-containing protein [Kitasatospora aureofaciens]MBV6702711.1 RNA polymerase [Kitasatospora aureofaciens]